MMTIFGVNGRRASRTKREEKTPVKHISDLRIVMKGFMLVNGEAIFLEKEGKKR